MCIGTLTTNGHTTHLRHRRCYGESTDDHKFKDPLLCPPLSAPHAPQFHHGRVPNDKRNLHVRKMHLCPSPHTAIRSTKLSSGYKAGTPSPTLENAYSGSDSNSTSAPMPCLFRAALKTNAACTPYPFKGRRDRDGLTLS